MAPDAVFNIGDAVGQINRLPAGAFPLYQDEGSARASFIPAMGGVSGRTLVINPFEAANLSLFHEAEHFKLAVQAALAADPTAPQQLGDDEMARKVVTVVPTLIAENGVTTLEDRFAWPVFVGRLAKLFGTPRRAEASRPRKISVDIAAHRTNAVSVACAV